MQRKFDSVGRAQLRALEHEAEQEAIAELVRLLGPAARTDEDAARE